jgi:diguanylate cyclase (GGDEF)-like protein/PAS domain S-box-containing protein
MTNPLPLAVSPPVSGPEAEPPALQHSALADKVLKLADNVDSLLGLWGTDLRCRFANAAYQVWFGKSREEIMGMSMKELLGPLYEPNLPYVLGVLNGEIQSFEREMRLPDGTVRHSLISYRPVFTGGLVDGFTSEVTDVSVMKRLELELAEARRQAESLATHDWLTGLPNRVLLLDRISTAVAQAQRRGSLTGVVAFDLDDFKAVNDTYGHAAGDALLKEVATRMKAAIRKADTVTRLGGDEFIFLANEVASVDGLVSATLRIRRSVSQPFRIGTDTLVPGLSMGIALFPMHGCEAPELLAKADRALYEAKRLGKNRSSLAE